MNAPLYVSKATLILATLMDVIRSEGEGIDDHEEQVIKKDGIKYFISRHSFCCTPCDKEYVLTHVLYSVSEGFFSEILIGGDFLKEKIPDYGFSIFESVIENNESVQLFSADTERVKLGPFFSLNTNLKTKLYNLLEQQSVIPYGFIGTELWRIISREGGLSNIGKIWDELFDEEIAYHMRLLDPYCFDSSDDLFLQLI